MTSAPSYATMVRSRSCVRVKLVAPGRTLLFSFRPGLHYMCYSFDTVKDTWVYMDESITQDVGQWKDVVSRMTRARHMPVLCMYQKANF